MLRRSFSVRDVPNGVFCQRRRGTFSRVSTPASGLPAQSRGARVVRLSRSAMSLLGFSRQTDRAT